jgi:hypothetical protein
MKNLTLVLLFVVLALGLARTADKKVPSTHATSNQAPDVVFTFGLAFSKPFVGAGKTAALDPYLDAAYKRYKLKVIKRVAYGFRNKEYFFL